MNVKNKGYWNFLIEFFFIRNLHPWKLHTSYFIRRFLSLKSAQFINSPLELINFILSGIWTCHNGFMIPNYYFSDRVTNRFVWSLWFDLNVLQFQWMISSRSYNFRFNIFNNILQFCFAPHYERPQPHMGWSWATLVIPGYLLGLLQQFLTKPAPLFSSYFLSTLLVYCN
jgi:hypothetical protein